MVGEWLDSTRWNHTCEGDRAGWTIVGRTWEIEIRWCTVVHLNTHIQSYPLVKKEYLDIITIMDAIYTCYKICAYYQYGVRFINLLTKHGHSFFNHTTTF